MQFYRKVAWLREQCALGLDMTEEAEELRDFANSFDDGPAQLQAIASATRILWRLGVRTLLLMTEVQQHMWVSRLWKLVRVQAHTTLALQPILSWARR